MKKQQYLWQFIFGWMNFSLAVPSIYLMLGLPLIMRQYGWSGMEIGLFQLAALPTLFKFLFAVPVQKIYFGQRSLILWLAALTLPLMGLMLWLSMHNLIQQPKLLFIFAFGISILLTWLDIPLNTLAVQFFSRTQQVNTGSIRSAALFLGAIVGGGIMVFIHHRFGWYLPFLIMVSFILMGLMPFLFFKLNTTYFKDSTERRISTSLSLLQDWKGFFTQPSAKIWVGLLTFGFPFIGAVWLYLKPTLLDYGLSVSTVALTVGTLGGIAGAISSLIAAKITKHLGAENALLLYLTISVLAISFLIISFIFQLDSIFLIIAAITIGIGMGGVSAVLFSLTLLFCRKDYTAIDYGLQTTIFTLSRIVVPILAGILLDFYGHIPMFMTLLLAIILTLFITWTIRHRLGFSEKI